MQVILGLSIPALIVAHIVDMRLSGVLFGQHRGYLTQSLSCELIISLDVCTTAGLHADDIPSAQQVAIRGRLEPLLVHAVTDARGVSAPVSSAEKAIARGGAPSDDNLESLQNAAGLRPDDVCE